MDIHHFATLARYFNGPGAGVDVIVASGVSVGLIVSVGMGVYVGRLGTVTCTEGAVGGIEVS
jgi:hypothetical protein